MLKGWNRRRCGSPPAQSRARGRRLAGRFHPCRFRDLLWTSLRAQSHSQFPSRSTARLAAHIHLTRIVVSVRVEKMALILDVESQSRRKPQIRSGSMRRFRRVASTRAINGLIENFTTELISQAFFCFAGNGPVLIAQGLRGRDRRNDDKSLRQGPIVGDADCRIRASNPSWRQRLEPRQRLYRRVNCMWSA